MPLKLRNISASSLNFTNFPVNIPLREYDNSIETIFKDLSKRGILHSIYTWGSVTNPGISDLDLLVVLKDNAKLPLKYKSIYFMGNKSRYIVVHPFMVANKNSAQNARIIYPDTKFKKVFGEDIKLKAPKKSQLYALRACLLNDIIIRHLPRDFISILKSQKINVREILLRLKSMAYSIRLYNLVTGKHIEKSELYEKKIYELRKNWFEIDKKEQENSILKLFKDAFRASINIVDSFNSYLEYNKIAEIDKKIDEISYSGEKNKTIFIRDWSKSDGLDSGDNIKLPINLAAQLLCYSSQNGDLSRYIANNLLPKTLKYQFKNALIAEKRISILNAQAALAEKMGHLHFPAFFDFGYRPEKGIFNKIYLNVRKMRKKSFVLKN